jgi:glycerate 2-kinase
MRSDGREIFAGCLDPVDPYGAVKRFVHLPGHRMILGMDKKSGYELDLKEYDRISFVGAGKATAPMARAIEEMFVNRIHKGIINVKYGFTEDLKFTEITEPGHPVPDENSVKAPP